MRFVKDTEIFPVFKIQRRAYFLKMFFLAGLFTFGDFVSGYALVSQKLGHTIRRAGISRGKFQKYYVNIQGILWN